MILVHIWEHEGIMGSRFPWEWLRTHIHILERVVDRGERKEGSNEWSEVTMTILQMMQLVVVLPWVCILDLRSPSSVCVYREVTSANITEGHTTILIAPGGSNSGLERRSWLQGLILTKGVITRCSWSPSTSPLLCQTPPHSDPPSI